MYFFKTYLIFWLIIIFPLISFAQETVVNLSYNPVIKKYLKDHKIWRNRTQRSMTDTLTLPFFDDFSKTSVYPDSSLWLERYVFINSDYSKNALSIGVASFDAINFDGSIYSTANSSGFGADTLSSYPINLDYPDDTTIYLSFMYQPQGNGDSPEENDSLILQFYSPLSTQWTTIWCASFYDNDSLVYEHHYYSDTIYIWQPASNTPANIFKTVIIPINDSIYLTNSFQFRFINYASIPNVYAPSMANNSDHWNIDYVYINNNRTPSDTAIDDVSFTQKLTPLLTDYSAIPWKHYLSLANPQEIIKDTLYFYYQNNGNKYHNYTVIYKIIDTYNDSVYLRNLGANNIEPFQSIIKTDTLTYIFPVSSSDSALYNIIAYLASDTDTVRKIFRWNDTMLYEQKFYNYYAYDDGTAEKGYGIIGNGTQNAKVAYKFYSYKKDTLTAVQIYFNQTINNASQNYFFLTIWDDNNGEPGNIIYSQIGTKPLYEDSLNEFHTYFLDTPQTVQGTFYVGWIKTTEDMINIGFDVNNNHADKIFYQISENWNNSSLSGSLMLRPVFNYYSPSSIPQINNKISFEVFPNPCSSYIYISVNINP